MYFFFVMVTGQYEALLSLILSANMKKVKKNPGTACLTINPATNEYPGYDIKLSVDKAPVMREI